MYAKTYSLMEQFEEHDTVLEAVWGYFTLERGLYIGIGIFLMGVLIDLRVLLRWIAVGFGPLNEVRRALFATTLIVIALQTVFSSFFLSLLGLRRPRSALR